MDSTELTRRSDGIWTALAGLNGPDSFMVLLSALATVASQAPSGDHAMLRTTAMRALKFSARLDHG